MHKTDRFASSKIIFLGLAALFFTNLACSAHYLTSIEAEEVKSKDLSNQSWSFSSFCDLDLSGKDFSNADLSQSVFQEVNAEGAIFRGANLSGAYFQFANLRGADLSGATLDGAIFTNADLTNALLDEKWAKIMPLLVSGDGEAAQLQGYDLRNVNFQKYTPVPSFCDSSLVEWEQSFVFNLNEADLEKALLDEASLSGATLRNANLRFATLNGANLSFADLQGANLTGANLSNALLYQANLQNTDLRQATLEGADLQFAVLTSALVNQDQFKNAILGCTVLPDGTIYSPKDCLGVTPEWGNTVND